MPYLMEVFLIIAFQFQPTTYSTTYATTSSTCTTRDLLGFAIPSVATYCELDLCT